ncbi:2'-5' RNA ligase family protein [Kitasatospora sp. NBC_01300]|uniref:2'-5' RNA ligase family protein n=1 Tax=Kitasatospora sp. NBC_01300 TaxID=2903574 RepID=UPI002F91039D|nr:2'-5' RNA ligase family protein [Kitasatospora sp. NBC_01300]
MKAFHPTFGRQPWPDGLRVLQVYALPDLPPGSALHTLLADLRTALAGFPVLPVPDERAHITLDMLTSAPADAITEAERRHLADQLRAAVTGTGPVSLQAGSPIAYRTGVRLDLHPDGELAALQHRVRAAVHQVFGPDSTDYPLGVLHTTVGYAAADTDTDELAQVIHRVRPGHASFRVSRIIVNEVYWRPAQLPGRTGLIGQQICWNTLATIRLDG